MNTARKMSEQVLGRSEWAAWIRRKLDVHARTYRNDPDRLIADYRREVQIKTDYKGREILELLQNANDAAAEVGKKADVYIKISKNGVCVANTGAPFSEGGLGSLMLSDLSPKRSAPSRLIGSKGLGLRSILNWGDCPCILSGGMHVQFEPFFGINWLREQCQRESGLREAVERERKLTGTWPLPRFLVPKVLSEPNERKPNQESNGNARNIVAMARKLRAEGYDTVVGVPYTGDEVAETARSAILELPKEILFLVGNIASVTVEANGTVRTWRCSIESAGSGADGDLIVLKTDGDPNTSKWRRWVRRSTVPQKLLEPGQRARPEYEIIVAIPEEQAEPPRTLFSYFPTKVRFPWPLLCHVTLDLTNNRQHVQETDANRYVLAQLAKVLAEVAERRVTRDDPWRALRLVAPDAQVEIAGLNFSDELRDRIVPRKIVPTLSGRFRASKRCARIKGNYGSWLPKSAFGDLVPHPDDRLVSQFLDRLPIPKLEATDIVTRIEAIVERLTVRDRAKLVAKLIGAELIPSDTFPNLWTNAGGKIISLDASTFVSPANAETPSLPSWARVDVLHADFVEELRVGFEVDDSRELIQELRAYRHVHEYSLQDLTSALVASGTRAAKEAPDKKDAIRLELIQSLFSLYRRMQTNRQIRKRATARVLLPAKSGEFYFADQLYFTAEYVAAGAVTENLYGFDSTKLLAPPDAMGLVGPPEALAQFLGWLGVDTWPRAQVTDGVDQNFLEEVTDSFKYPIRFDDDPHSYEISELWNARLERVATFDSLGKILEHAPVEAIVAWLALDLTLDRFIREKDRKAVFSAIPSRKHNRRCIKGRNKNYVRWLFRNRQWVPTELDDRRTPTACTLAGRLPRGLERLLPRPKLDERAEPLSRNDVDQIQIVRAFELAGAIRTLEDLEWEPLYNLLFELPKADPEGKSARALYRLIVESRDAKEAPPDSLRKAFISDGRLWGTKGAKSTYFNPKELRYADQREVPDILRPEVALFGLEKRRGAKKVELLFGVKSLANERTETRVTQAKHSSLAKDFEAEIEDLKPYVFATRLSHDISGRRVKTISDTKVRLCDVVEADVQFRKKVFHWKLDNGDWLSDGNEYFLRMSSRSGPPLLRDMDMAQAVGTIFAELVPSRHDQHYMHLARANKSERIKLLSLLIGNDAPQLLNDAREMLSIPQPGSKTAPFVISQPDGQGVADGGAEELPANDENERVQEEDVTDLTPQPGDDGEVANEQIQSDPVTTVLVKQKPHVPKPPPGKIRFRVRKQKRKRSSSWIRRITDEERCEQLALAFEISDRRPRYPLGVGHIQGYEGPRCDILSFSSSGDLDRFRKTSDLLLVRRFIEVKGRGSLDATIALRGNEKDAALDHADRYFLYRMYEADDGKIDLLVVRDPLGQTEAVDWVAEIDPQRAGRAEHYELDTSPGAEGKKNRK